MRFSVDDQALQIAAKTKDDPKTVAASAELNQRKFDSLLQLGQAKGYAKLQSAVESALALGCADEAAVRYLLLTESENRPPQVAVEVGWLDRYARPLPVLNEYDELLGAEVAP